MGNEHPAAQSRLSVYARVSRHLRLADFLWDRHADFRRWWGPLRPVKRAENECR